MTPPPPSRQAAPSAVTTYTNCTVPRSWSSAKPENIRLAIRPFRGAERYELDARFRFRINNGQLTMWYDLKRPEKVFETAIAGELTSIEVETKSNLVIHCTDL